MSQFRRKIPSYQNAQTGQQNFPYEQNFINQQIQVPRNKPRETFLRRLRFIPKFSGDSFTQLNEFIDVVESLYVSCRNESEENELYEQISLQLRGEAKNFILALDNPDWETIKNSLLKYFAYLANKEILTSQLENARQYKDESLNAFANRVRKLLRDKKATYSYMTEEQKLEYDRLARRTFSRGLSNIKLRNRLVTRGASSLENAIAYAIEFENDDSNHIPSDELFCLACRSSGHRQINCRHQNSEKNQIAKLISAIRLFVNKDNYNYENVDGYMPEEPGSDWNLNGDDENFFQKSNKRYLFESQNNNRFKRRRLNEIFEENDNFSVSQNSEPEIDSTEYTYPEN